jgi:organic radical activating enzyme
MVSSVKEALSYLQEKLENNSEDQHKARQKRAPSHRGGSSRQNFNVEELADLLNIIPDQAEQVEGNIELSLAGGQRFFAFDNHTLDAIPKRKYRCICSSNMTYNDSESSRDIFYLLRYCYNIKGLREHSYFKVVRNTSYIS